MDPRHVWRSLNCSFSGFSSPHLWCIMFSFFLALTSRQYRNDFSMISLFRNTYIYIRGGVTKGIDKPIFNNRIIIKISQPSLIFAPFRLEHKFWVGKVLFWEERASHLVKEKQNIEGVYWPTSMVNCFLKQQKNRICLEHLLTFAICRDENYKFLSH